jgi:hypothetical protein
VSRSVREVRSKKRFWRRDRRRPSPEIKVNYHNSLAATAAPLLRITPAATLSIIL